MKIFTQLFKTLFLSISLIAGVLPAFSQTTEKSITVAGERIGFLEYKPAGYNPNDNVKYPVIIFLHGIGERGNGTTQLKNVSCCGIPRIIALGNKMRFTWNGKTETFLVLSPQCPMKYGMWPAPVIDDLVKYAKQNLSSDTNRIFLTGLSMGGGGTYRYISTNPQQPKNIAAAATICAPCTFNSGADVANANLPVWSFHAFDDPTASVGCTEQAIRDINNAKPAVKPLKDIWPAGGHIVWDRVYTDTNYKYQGVVNIYEWFLGQNKSWAVNKLPTARAGQDLNTTTGTGIVTLNASASTDPDGKLVRFVWKKLSGPAAGVITKPMGTASSTTVTGLSLPGTYLYELAVVDDRASFHRDTVSVVVTSAAALPNKAPVAKAGTDVTITLPANTASLNGSTSSDEDGTIATYAWTKVSGPDAAITTANAASTTIKNLVEGTYSFKLTVTDNKGTRAEDLVTVIVHPAPAPANIAPVAKAGNDIVIKLPVNTAALNGNASSDEDGTIATYAWTKVSGPDAAITDAASATAAVKNLVEGTYSFKLTVTDNKGATAYDAVMITVKAADVVVPPAPPADTVATPAPTPKPTPKPTPSPVPNPAKANKAPIVRAGTDVVLDLPNCYVLLNGTLTTDTGGWVVSYTWTQLSGPIAKITTPNTNKARLWDLVAGVYNFRLTAIDNGGLTAYDDIMITVNPADTVSAPKPVDTIAQPKPVDTIATPEPEPVPVSTNKAPVVVAGADTTLILPNNYYLLNGSRTTDTGGWVVSYQWTKISGPSVTMTTPNTSQARLWSLVAGVYTFRLTATDNKGAVAYDDVVLNVKTRLEATNSFSAADQLALAATNKAAEVKISLYPNPAVSTLNIQYSSKAVGQSAIVIYDASGNIAKSITFEKTQATFQQNIDISGLKTGMYYVKANTGQTISVSAYLVKQ